MLHFFKKFLNELFAKFFVRESSVRNVRFQKRGLGFEVLENRELLSANPIDDLTIDWSWSNDSGTPPVVILPQADIYAIDYGGCVPFGSVDFLLSDSSAINQDSSIGGGISTGTSGAPNPIYLDNSLYDNNNNLGYSNAGILLYYTTETGFIGSDIYNYNILDTESTETIATGLIVIEVLPSNVGSGDLLEVLPEGFNIDPSSSTFGQISIAGNNSAITADAQFTPTITETYIANASITTEPTNKVVNGIEGTANETLEIKISSDFFTNGDWFYAETVDYTYSISNSDGVYWGGYSYAFYAGLIGGDYHHTFVVCTSDYFFVVDSIDDLQSGNTTTSYKSKAIGGTVDTTYINYIDDTDQINVTEIHKSMAASFTTSYGSYQYLVAGGIIEGTFESNTESRNSSYQEIINVTENNQTSTTGSFTTSIYDKKTDSYIGGGDYLIQVDNDDSSGDFTRTQGTINESGNTKNESTYDITGNLSNGEWTKTGNATLNHEYESNFCNYDKYKFQISTSDVNGNYTDKGRYINESTTQQDGNQTTNLSLITTEIESSTGGEFEDVTEWATVSGSGENNVVTADKTDNKVTRTYQQSGSAAGKTWSNNGTALQRDKTEYDAEHHVTSIWNNGNWIYTGEGEGSGSNFHKSTFNETGTYTSTFTQDSIEFSINDGEMSRSGLDKLETTFTTSSELVDGEWVDIGSGTSTGISKTQSEYFGDGTFELTIVDERIVGDNILTGEVEESGNEKFKSEWSSEIELQDGIWITLSGEGDTTTKGKTLFEYSGEATTTEQYNEENTTYDLSTERNVSGKEKSKWTTESHNEVVDGEWATLSGNGDSDGTSLQEFSSDSEGTYTTTSTATSPTGDSNNFTISGDIDFGESNKEKAIITGTLTWNTEINDWDLVNVVDWQINCDNYFNKVSSEGSFEESLPTTTVTSGCVLYDNSAGQLTTQAEKSLTGDVTEELHTTYSLDVDYTINIDAEGNETLVSGNSKKKIYEDSETVWNGDGTFSQELTYKNSNDATVNATTISGSTKIQDKKTTREYNETVKEEVIDGEWKLKSGHYKDVTKETGTTKVTTEVETENYFGNDTETKTTKTINKEKSNIKTVYKGEVVDGELEGDDKTWQHTGTSTDNSSGNYSYEETVENAKYSRDIDGGEVSGTITISTTNTTKYGADDIVSVLEGDGEESGVWALVSGSRWTESSIDESETCSGTGSYSTSVNGVSLTGTISESWDYTTTSTNAKITETYDATTQEWTKSSGQGSLTYSESKTFSDSATGTFEVEDGTGTINEREVTDNYYYTVTEYLSSGNVYFTQMTTTSYKYDAEIATSVEQTVDGELTGTRKQWTKDEVEVEEALSWVEDSGGVVDFLSGSYETSFEYESGLSFDMDDNGAGSTNFTEYSFKSKITSESDNLSHTLDVDAVNLYLSELEAGVELSFDWLDEYWETAGGSVTATETYELGWKKSNNDSDVSR
ncbi:MAG: hypothetical protein LBH59_11570, partial [Planctomycetaceae bacterium]|nr:hypothetical protein [Planctomycetaceae bacterium]